MSMEEYRTARRLGLKQTQGRVHRGEAPGLPVLEDILPSRSECTEQSLGTIEIPLSRVVGTVTRNRGESFSVSFLPLLEEGSEFAGKWAVLHDSAVSEGIREPITAVEYLNRFYVQEGNKRVSVLKFLGAEAVTARVTRLIPPLSDDKEIKIYYEFLDFYRLTGVNDIRMSEEGRFPALLEALHAEKPLSPDARHRFRAYLAEFGRLFREAGGASLGLTTGDALLRFTELHGYEKLLSLPIGELNDLIKKSMDEFRLQASERIHLQMDPNEEKKTLLSQLLPGQKLPKKVGFLYGALPEQSSWVMSHELGRRSLEKQHEGGTEMIVRAPVEIDTADAAMEELIAEGCTVLFATSPAYLNACVRIAMAHPEVKVLNCSLNTAPSAIRTYYCRQYEVKFIMGAVAGAIADYDRILYVADYPIAGTMAAINAFAMGVAMTNPRAKICLEWSSARNYDLAAAAERFRPDCICGADTPAEGGTAGAGGLFRREADGHVTPLIYPVFRWGSFYERLLRRITDGAWANDAEKDASTCYWWGMRGGLVDVEYAPALPGGVAQLADLLRLAIKAQGINPFAGPIRDNAGGVHSAAGETLRPADILQMDWLADNILGHIPPDEELQGKALPILKEQRAGLRREVCL